MCQTSTRRSDPWSPVDFVANKIRRCKVKNRIIFLRKIRKTKFFDGRSLIAPTDRILIRPVLRLYKKHPRFHGNGGVAQSHKDVLPQLKSRTPKGCSLLRRTEERIGRRASRLTKTPFRSLSRERPKDVPSYAAPKNELAVGPPDSQRRSSAA